MWVDKYKKKYNKVKKKENREKKDEMVSGTHIVKQINEKDNF